MPKTAKILILDAATEAWQEQPIFNRDDCLSVCY